MTGLELDKKYYVRAFVRQLDKTYYSESTNFTLDTSLPSIVALEASPKDFEKRSVVLNGEIKSVGTPALTEKGFVYSQTANPTINDSKIIVEGNTSGAFSAPVTGLELNKTYYVRVYAKQLENTYYSEPTSFILETSQPVIVAKEASVDINKRSAVLNGEVSYVGEPTFTEKGFVYSQTANPTINDSKIIVEGNTSGAFSAPVTGLELNKTYYVRVYAKQLENTYYSEPISFILSIVPPVFNMKEISETSYTAKQAKVTATITNPGQPNYTTRGFVYGIKSNPDIYNDKSKSVSGSGTGDFSLYLTDLATEQQYFVRAYVEQEGNIHYSNEMKFTLMPVNAELDKIHISEVDNNSAKVTCSIIGRGDPVYTEKGFVYNKDGNPVVEKNLGRTIVEGNSSGDFMGRISGLTANTTYYVKGYVKQNGNTLYTSEVSFKTGKQEPIVVTNEASNILLTTATLNATISDIGDPAYDRRGFYYSTNKNPTIDNSIIKTEKNNSEGDFSMDIDNLKELTTYYYKAFVIQPGETEPKFGNVASFITGYKPGVYTYDATDLICTGTDKSNLNWSATLNGNIAGGRPTPSTCGFVYGTVDNPTIDDGSSTFIKTANTSGTISASVSGFKTNVSYRYRTVAITPLGYYYGESKEFTPKVVTPTITTYPISSLTCTGTDESNLNWSAKIVGHISDSGNPSFTSCGFVYGTSDLPTVDDGSSIYISSTYSSTGYSSTITGLKTNQHYRIRAVAITPLGYYYGNIIEFSTNIQVPDITTYRVLKTPITSDYVNYTTVVSLDGTYENIGIPQATAFGFVYSTNNNPTINDESSTNITISPSDVFYDRVWGCYHFSASIQLKSTVDTGKKYYVRAYAKTVLGTYYGEELTFQTP